MEVDTETGNIRVLKMVSVFDAGKVINPQMYEGQAEGAMVQALGTALFEELKLKEGRVLNPSFVDYKIPTMDDMPEMIVEAVGETGADRPVWRARHRRDRHGAGGARHRQRRGQCHRLPVPAHAAHAGSGAGGASREEGAAGLTELQAEPGAGDPAPGRHRLHKRLKTAILQVACDGAAMSHTHGGSLFAQRRCRKPWLYRDAGIVA